MANCKKCARCGEFYECYESEAGAWRFYSEEANGICFSFEPCIGGNVYTRKRIDLCPECFGDLVRFMDGKGEDAI